jgi:negative regulator of flagellin synthesis FlgM
MKIDNHGGTGAPNGPGEALGVRRDVDRGQQTRQGATTPGGDKVSVSEEARTLSRLRQEIGSVDAVRADKVEALRDKIESGQYKVDLKAVARKFLESLFGERNG